MLTRERPDSATVALRLAVRTGSRDEDDLTSGGSHWLVHAHFLGTETRPSPQAIENAIAAVGNLRHKEAVEKIERALASLPRGARHLRPPTPEPAQREPRRLEIDEGTLLAEMRLGWPVPCDLDADAPAMYVLEDILGLTGRRLNEEIRDRRALASSVGPNHLAFSDAGALMIAVSTQPERVEPVLHLALAEIQRLRDGAVTDEDVATSLRAIAGRRALADELNQDQAARSVGEVTGTIESFDEYLARLSTVRPADVQRVAQTYLDPDRAVVVVVGPPPA